MNVFQFEQKLAKKENGKVNIIYQQNKNSFLNTTIDGKSSRKDVKGDKYITYKSVSSLQKNSKSYVKSYPTYLVKVKGTDAANWKTEKIK